MFNYNCNKFEDFDHLRNPYGRQETFSRPSRRHDGRRGFFNAHSNPLGASFGFKFRPCGGEFDFGGDGYYPNYAYYFPGHSREFYPFEFFDERQCPEQNRSYYSFRPSYGRCPRTQRQAAGCDFSGNENTREQFRREYDRREKAREEAIASAQRLRDQHEKEHARRERSRAHYGRYSQREKQEHDREHERREQERYYEIFPFIPGFDPVRFFLELNDAVGGPSTSNTKYNLNEETRSTSRESPSSSQEVESEKNSEIEQNKKVSQGTKDESLIKEEKLEAGSSDKERLEKERLEKERLEKERLEKEKLENEKLENERLEKERLEKERLEKERLEKERLEKERLEKEKLEKEKLEKERLEKERLEKERLEKERLEKEKLHTNNSTLLASSVEKNQLENSDLTKKIASLIIESIKEQKLIPENYDFETLTKAVLTGLKLDDSQSKREESEFDLGGESFTPVSPALAASNSSRSPSLENVEDEEITLFRKKLSN